MANSTENDRLPQGWPSPEVQLLEEIKELRKDVTNLNTKVNEIQTQVEILKTRATQWGAIIVVLGNIIGPVVLWVLNSASK